MADNVINVVDVASNGVVLDTPPIALATNIFTDVRNVRFTAGAIRKMEGEVLLNEIAEDLVPANETFGKIRHVALWEHPTLQPYGCFYIWVVDYLRAGIIIGQKIYAQDHEGNKKDITPPINMVGNAITTTATATINTNVLTVADATGLVLGDFVEGVGITTGSKITNISGLDITISLPTILTLSSTSVKFGLVNGFKFTETGWQDTIFNGGFSFIINNGIDKPHYITDSGSTGSLNDLILAALPSWDGYNIRQRAAARIFSGEGVSDVFNLARIVDFSAFSVTVTVNGVARTVEAGTPAGAGALNGVDFVPGEFTSIAALPAISPTAFQIYFNVATNTTVVYIGNLAQGNDILVSVNSRNPVNVSCGIIESFGNLLVAGNITERDGNNTVSRKPGVIRTSDVAFPGSLPQNWDPYANTGSTSDEFTLSETNVIQDLSSLQGDLYIYATGGIHKMSLTGDEQIPTRFESVTDEYGVLTRGGVVEFDGKHFVIGSNDIYLFAGNTGDIQSVADDKVRAYFFNNLNPIHEQKLFTLLNHSENEIWICYPTLAALEGECDEALIWNYRDSTWTIRDLNNVTSGTVGPIKGGGIPTATLALTGTSGNAGYTNVGKPEVQNTVFATTPSPTSEYKRWWALKNFDALKITNKFVVLNSFVNQTISARQVQKFTWAADASTGGTGSPYKSSGIWTLNGVDYDRELTWVIYQFPNAGVDWSRENAAIGITLAPNLTTLSDILDDIVTKMNNSGFNYYSQAGRWEDKYEAWKENNSIYIRPIAFVSADQTTTRFATGPRTTFPSTSTNAALNSPVYNGVNLTPHNGVFLYGGYNNVSNPPYLQYPESNRYPASDLVGANFPTPTIIETVAGTTVANKPSIDNGWLRLAYNSTNTAGSDGYRMYIEFDGVLTPATIIARLKHIVNVKYRNSGNSTSYFEAIDDPSPPAGTTSLIIRQRVGGPVTVPLSGSRPTTPSNPYSGGHGGFPSQNKSSFDLSWFMQGDVPNPYNNTIIPHESDDRFTNPYATNVRAYMYSGADGADSGTTDSITFNLPLGENFTTTLTDRVYDPEGTGDALELEEEPLLVMERIRDQYNASFGGASQPLKYYSPTIVTGASPNPFSINWRLLDNLTNLVPISWSLTLGTSRDIYTFPNLSRNGGFPVNLFNSVDSPYVVQDLVTVTPGAQAAYAKMTRVTVTLTTSTGDLIVWDKHYGEGPGRLLDPNFTPALNDNTYGDTGATDATAYLSLYYNPDGVPAVEDLKPNGVVVDTLTAMQQILANFISSRQLTVIADNLVTPTELTVSPNQFGVVSNYVNFFSPLSQVIDASVAPITSLLIAQPAGNLVPATPPGQDTTGSTINSSLDIVRPWAQNKIDPAKSFPIFSQFSYTNNVISNRLSAADLGYDFGGVKYISYFERQQMSITPTFNTETVASMSLWADGGTASILGGDLKRATLQVRARGTNVSGEKPFLTLPVNPVQTNAESNKLVINEFVVASNHKVDTRVQGRLISYRIDDALGSVAGGYLANNDKGWNISGIQIKVTEGGVN